MLPRYKPTLRLRLQPIPTLRLSAGPRHHVVVWLFRNRYREFEIHLAPRISLPMCGILRRDESILSVCAAWRLLRLPFCQPTETARGPGDQFDFVRNS
jgi:hypothetical protein